MSITGFLGDIDLSGEVDKFLGLVKRIVDILIQIFKTCVDLMNMVAGTKEVLIVLIPALFCVSVGMEVLKSLERREK